MAALGVVLLAELDPRTGAQEAGGDERLVRHVIELVARDLLADELVVRLVGVEGVDDVVAVAPGVGPVVVLLEPAGVRVARHVQPVAAPALAVVRRVEQPVYQPLPGAARRVGEVLVDLRRRRRQAGQVEICPAQERQPVGLRRRGHARVTPRCLQETVDGMRVRSRRRHGSAHRALERPVLPRARRQAAALQRLPRVGGRRGRRGVPVRPAVDPGAHRLQLAGTERVAAHRHWRLVQAGHHPEQAAVLGAPRHQRRSARAAFQRAVTGAQVEAGKLRRRAVAVPAAPLHDGADVVGERDRTGLRRGDLGAARGHGQGQSQQGG